MTYQGRINYDPELRGSMRDAFCQALLEAGQISEDVFVLTADQGKSVKPFASKYPDRFLDVGIAEANMVGIAAGLAMSGKKPFVTTIAAILILRACEQIRNDVCIQHVAVKIVGHGGGISYGVLGPTHHSIEDIAITRAMPHMTVVAPADPVEAGKAIIAAIDFPGPLYIRLGTGKEQIIYQDDYDFKIGEPVVLKEGADICILANSQALVQALAAARQLQQEGIDAGVVNVHTVKPLSKTQILKAAGGVTDLITLEEHNISGGLGSAVSEALSEEKGYRVVRMGVPDCFAPVATREELYKKYGMDKGSIIKQVRTLTRRK